jgi:hypothetical protein
MGIGPGFPGARHRAHMAASLGLNVSGHFEPVADREQKTSTRRPPFQRRAMANRRTAPLATKMSTRHVEIHRSWLVPTRTARPLRSAPHDPAHACLLPVNPGPTQEHSTDEFTPWRRKYQPPTPAVEHRPCSFRIAGCAMLARRRCAQGSQFRNDVPLLRPPPPQSWSCGTFHRDGSAESRSYIASGASSSTH